MINDITTYKDLAKNDLYIIKSGDTITRADLEKLIRKYEMQRVIAKRDNIPGSNREFFKKLTGLYDYLKDINLLDKDTANVLYNMAVDDSITRSKLSESGLDKEYNEQQKILAEMENEINNM